MMVPRSGKPFVTYAPFIWANHSRQNCYFNIKNPIGHFIGFLWHACAAAALGLQVNLNTRPGTVPRVTLGAVMAAGTMIADLDGLSFVLFFTGGRAEAQPPEVRCAVASIARFFFWRCHRRLASRDRFEAVLMAAVERLVTSRLRCSLQTLRRGRFCPIR